MYTYIYEFRYICIYILDCNTQSHSDAQNDK